MQRKHCWRGLSWVDVFCQKSRTNYFIVWPTDSDEPLEGDMLHI